MARPYLNLAAAALLGVAVIILLPLTIFRRSRRLAGCGFVFSSAVFGLTFLSGCFTAAAKLCGLFGPVVALLSAGVFVPPLAFIASAGQGEWSVLLELVAELIVTIGPASLGYKFYRPSLP
jgi:hypothetical protein